MSDGRFYTLCLLAFGAFIIAAILVLNLAQPSGVDVQIWNLITTPATTIIGLLVLMINSNARSRQITEAVSEKVETKAQEVKDAVATQPKAIQVDATIHGKG